MPKLANGTEQKCGNCKFYYLKACVYNPPVVDFRLKHKRSEEHESEFCLTKYKYEKETVFPGVSEYQWCGKWEQSEWVD